MTPDDPRYEQARQALRRLQLHLALWAEHCSEQDDEAQRGMVDAYDHAARLVGDLAAQGPGAAFTRRLTKDKPPETEKDEE